MWGEASVGASKMAFVQANLTDQGYKATQGEQASRVRPDGWWQREK